MPQKRKDGPYVWATWVTKLLAGDDECEWAAWFKAHHVGSSWQKAVDSADLSDWKLRHSQRLKAVRQEWVEEGYEVFIEKQNDFKLMGRAATLSGTPDLIARHDSHGTIVDVKTGTPRDSDIVQVKLYMLAVPLVSGRHSGVEFDGMVVYNDHEVLVPSVDRKFLEAFTGLMCRLASDEPPIKIPSLRECGFCKITSQDCPERLVGERSEGMTNLF